LTAEWHGRLASVSSANRAFPGHTQDAPELGPDFFANAILWPKQQITLRLDPDLLAFFRKHGRGY
jgi:uncharacterized protein (DUF4415 family)